MGSWYSTPKTETIDTATMADSLRDGIPRLVNGYMKFKADLIELQPYVPTGCTLVDFEPLILGIESTLNNLNTNLSTKPASILEDKNATEAAYMFYSLAVYSIVYLNVHAIGDAGREKLKEIRGVL